MNRVHSGDSARIAYSRLKLSPPGDVRTSSRPQSVVVRAVHAQAVSGLANSNFADCISDLHLLVPSADLVPELYPPLGSSPSPPLSLLSPSLSPPSLSLLDSLCSAVQLLSHLPAVCTLVKHDYYSTQPQNPHVPAGARTCSSGQPGGDRTQRKSVQYLLLATPLYPNRLCDPSPHSSAVSCLSGSVKARRRGPW